MEASPKYTGFKFNREPLKFECLFDNINEYEGWLEFNRFENENLQGMILVDFDARHQRLIIIIITGR
jgi:hypothetical protein